MSSPLAVEVVVVCLQKYAQSCNHHFYRYIIELEHQELLELQGQRY